MILLPHFRSSLPEAVGDDKVLQDAFLCFLFPDNFPVAGMMPIAGGDLRRSYKLVAAAGFLLAAGNRELQKGFEAGMVWLEGIVAPPELREHPVALMGIALGLRANGVEAKPRLRKLLEAIAHLSQEVRAFAEQLACPEYQPWPEDSDETLQIAAGLLSDPPKEETERLGKYLARMRKEDPAELLVSPPKALDASGQLLFCLTAFVIDHALARALDSPDHIVQEIAEGTRKALAPMQALLVERMARRGRHLVVAGSLLAFIGLSLAGFLLFACGPGQADHRSSWDFLKWGFLFVGAPVAAFSYLTRVLYFLAKGRKPDWTLGTLSDQLANLLLRRFTRRWKVPNELP